MKTFSIHSSSGSWSNQYGMSLLLRGGFYDYGTAKTFKQIKTILLVEKETKLPSYLNKDETWLIQASKELMEEIESMDVDPQEANIELIIDGKRKNVDKMFATVAYRD